MPNGCFLADIDAFKRRPWTFLLMRQRYFEGNQLEKSDGDIKALKIPAKYNLEGTFSESEPDESHNRLENP